MKHTLMVAMLAAVSSFALSQTMHGSANQKGGDEHAVRQMLNELSAAVGRNDIGALDRIYADSFTFVSDSGVLMTKARRLAAMKSGELKYASVSFDDVNVRLYGDTAVATFRTTSKGQSGGQDFGGQYVVTATFVKMHGRWQEVAAQSTRVTGT
jgi:ketosteroid isomerase-like protein